jgi:hypothetical protein
MAMNSPASSAAVCLARAFKVRVFPGQEDAYERYLREAVEPIDAIAHEAGVFAHMVAMCPEDACGDWTHARVFFFTDATQRERFTEAMAQAAARFDGTAAAAERRLALAATLREKVGTSDYRVSG